MSAIDDASDRREYLNFRQLCAAIRRKKYMHKKFTQLVIEKLVNINYKNHATDFLKLHQPEFIGCTALHFALSADNFVIFNILLDNRAAFNVRNHEEMTVLRCAIEDNFVEREITKLRRRFDEYSKKFAIDEVNGFLVMERIIDGEAFWKHDNWRLWGKVEENKYVNSILSASLKTKNLLKRANDDGISLLHAACLTNNVEAVAFLLKNGADVNAPSSSPIFHGFTPLHFAVKYSSVELVKILLDSGANLIAHKNKTMSAADMLVDHNLKIMEWLHAKNKLPYKNSILDYVENEEKLKAIMDTNFGTEWTGFSSFHVACTMTNVSSVPTTCSARGQLTLDKFLEGDHWHVYDRVSSIPTDYPWSGFTALHFAAFFNVDTAKLLIESGADIEAENKLGVTPLDILETRAKIEDLHFTVSHNETWKCIVLSDGKTRLLDLISSMKNLSSFENFLNDIDINISIPNDAPLWPGYTVLHLAVTFSETVKKVEFLKNIFHSHKSDFNAEYESCFMEQEISYLGRINTCLKKNADVTVQDKRGRTPINLAFRQRNTEAVNLMVRHHDETVNPTDEDNLSHLHIACAAKNLDLVEKLLANGANANAAIKSSFKWHCDYHRCTSTDVFDLVGSTPLHLCSSFGDIDSAKLLLNKGADVNAKDALGLSAVHRIFVLQQLWETANKLIHRYEPKVYTFHITAPEPVRGYRGASKILSKMYVEFLSTSTPKESVADADFALSYLHVATYKNNDVEAAKRLLDLDSSVNSIVRCPRSLAPSDPLFVLSRYEGYTPLHMCNFRKSAELEIRLVERHADFLTRRADGTNVLFDKLRSEYRRNVELYVRALKENERLRARLRDEFGWTMLHVACQLVDLELASFALSIGVDVNSRANEDSPMHPGCTALHVLTMQCHRAAFGWKSDDFNAIFSSLLAGGSDATVADVRGDTALHRSDYAPPYVFGCSNDNCIYADLLLRQIRDFSVNPTNHEGISLLHIACVRSDVDVVGEYLNHGMNANEPIDFFGRRWPGRTPLHLAARYRSASRARNLEAQLRIVAMLLTRGADARAEDAYYGDTPLHAAAECDAPRIAVLRMLLRYGADVNAKNVKGQTPLELLLRSSKITGRELEFFLKQGCRLNVANETTQVGMMSLVFRHVWRGRKNDVGKVAMSCPSIDEVDDRGRTVIHNVATTGLGVIGFFVERGYDVDSRDNSGKTALHLAAGFRDYEAVEALLIYGCDANVIDSSGKTAFACTLERESLCDLIETLGCHNHHLVVQTFMRYFHHASQRGLRVNEVNGRTFAVALDEFTRDRVEIEAGYERLKRARIGETAFTVDDFLSETKAIVRYSRIWSEDREAFERFFTVTLKEYEFSDWSFLCKMQYRKAMQRAGLVELARDAMNFVLGFPLPHLCYGVVEKYFSNMDLKSLIVAATH